MTIGVKDKRGDWVEEKGQRLLWQPVMVAFAPNGDVYIVNDNDGAGWTRLLNAGRP